MRRRDGIDGSELRFWLGLIGLFVVLSLVSLWLWVVVPSTLLRGHSVVVTSGSMGPVIETGDVLVLKRHDGGPLKPGAVVTFHDPSGEGLLTHRIMQVNEDGSYRTQGDANTTMDSAAVRPERIVGNAKLLIPLLGLPTVWLANGNVPGLAAWLAGVLLSAWVARYALLRRYDPWYEVSWGSAHTRGRRRGWTWWIRPRPVPAGNGWSVGLWELNPALPRTLLVAAEDAERDTEPVETRQRRILQGAAAAVVR